jgi:drug/metabolite transporter (DMT)-like permease
VQPGDRRGLLAVAIVANLIGGTSYVLTKVALDALTETTLVVVRTTVALAVLVPLAGRGLSRVLRAPGDDRRRLFAMAWLGYALPLVLGSYGVRRATATDAALLIGTEPLAVVLLGALVLGEALSRIRLAALGLGLVGASVLVANGVPFVGDGHAPHLIGDLLLVAHGVAWSIYTIAGKPLLGRYDPIAVSTASLVLALPCLVPIAALELPGVVWDWSRLAPSLGAAVTLGLVVSALMTVLWNTALRGIDASALAGFIFLQPLAGTALGVLALGERLTGAALAGGTLVLAAVFLLAGEPSGFPVRSVADVEA